VKPNFNRCKIDSTHSSKASTVCVPSAQRSAALRLSLLPYEETEQRPEPSLESPIHGCECLILIARCVFRESPSKTLL
jgi:hypothetical protein